MYVIKCSRLTSILEVIRPSQTVNNFLKLIMGVNFTLPNNVQPLQVLLHVSLNCYKNE